MKTKRHILSAIMASLALASTAPAAVVYSTAGAVSYTYSAAGSGALPPSSDATLINITVASYTLFLPGSPGVTGLTNTGGTIGTATWLFQTGAGLQFSNNINLSVGTGRNASGQVLAEYSTDNVIFTQWGLNNNSGDSTKTATNVAAGKSNLYVRFTMDGAATGNDVITWGGGPNERAFTLAGTVVAIPEPSAALLGALGGLALLRRRR